MLDRFRTVLIRAQARSRFLFSAALVALVGCGSASDSPTATHPSGASRLAIIVVGGGSQQGFLGDVLGAPVIFQVIDSAGHPVAGKRRIRFSVVAGAGTVSDTSVFSADDGSASVTWRLGAAVGVQQLRASLADAGASAETSVFAAGVSPEAADLIVIRGATSGTVNMLVRQGDSAWTYALTWPDTVLRLLPHAQSESWQEVTAFSVGHPPATALQPWTAGVDTLRLTLRAPIAVPFTVWVTHDFDTTAARARYDLATVDKFWRERKTGLQVGTVRIENLSAYEGKIFQCSDVPGFHDSAAINVYYLANQIFDGTAARPAYACDAGTVLMGVNFYAYDPIYQLLLAHEVGHALGLDHVPDASNLMSNGWPNGGNITTGQIYRAHFHYWSALNSVVGVHPVGQRDCNVVRLTHCLEATFVGW